MSASFCCTAGWARLLFKAWFSACTTAGGVPAGATRPHHTVACTFTAGALSYGTAGVGSSGHMASALLERAGGFQAAAHSRPANVPWARPATGANHCG